MGFGVKREAEGGGTARRSNRVAESVSEDAVHCLTVHLLPLRACVSFSFNILILTGINHLLNSRVPDLVRSLIPLNIDGTSRETRAAQINRLF